MWIRKDPTVVKAEGQGYVVEYTTERGKEQVRHLTYLQAIDLQSKIEEANDRKSRSVNMNETPTPVRISFGRSRRCDPVGNGGIIHELPEG